jgi:ABC-type Mn2+/Zn2+ transport system ATPase subunit
VTLELFKRVKSTNQLKAQINFVIFYKGCEYNSIDCLSGGEADRVSLAFTIALNRISSSPLILLDECMSSLDQDIREQCLDCLKTLTGKTILLINHDGVEGHYDNVIKL